MIARLSVLTICSRLRTIRFRAKGRLHCSKQSAQKIRVVARVRELVVVMNFINSPRIPFEPELQRLHNHREIFVTDIYLFHGMRNQNGRVDCKNPL